LQGRNRLTSCVEYGQQGFYKDGIYKIYDNDGNSFPSYCDLKSEPGIAWTLVMSWSKKNRFISAFRSTPFQFNAPENENSPNWDRYRLSLERMRSLQVHSTHWRATCSYPTHGIDFTDYLRGNFKDFNIVDFLGNGECKKVEYVDIRGLNGTNLTAPFWANFGVGLHTDSSIDFCELNATVGAVSNGIYKIYDNDGNSFPSYCDLKSEPGIAWTLVMSWSKKNRFISAFRSTPFQFNAPENENSPNWDRYRLSLERMRSLQVHSTHWRATCSYPTHGIDFTDYLRGNFKDFNIVDFLGNGECKKVEYVDIRGLNGTNLTAPFWANFGVSLHTDSSIDFCELNATVGAVSSEDNFGSYNGINPKFRCTQEDSSTTQWWFGAHFKK
ncbi:unnamed protein product, partial [Porites lobata]